MRIHRLLRKAIPRPIPTSRVCQICRRISSGGNHQACTEFAHQKPFAYRSFLDAIKTLDEPDHDAAIVQYTEARSVIQMLQVIDEVSRSIDPENDPQARGVLSSISLGFSLINDDRHPELLVHPRLRLVL